jgi:hypothetical protein
MVVPNSPEISADLDAVEIGPGQVASTGAARHVRPVDPQHVAGVGEKFQHPLHRIVQLESLSKKDVGVQHPLEVRKLGGMPDVAVSRDPGADVGVRGSFLFRLLVHEGAGALRVHVRQPFPAFPTDTISMVTNWAWAKGIPNPKSPEKRRVLILLFGCFFISSFRQRYMHIV